MDLLTHFLAVFVPLFVAIDPFGLVPVFLGVTAEMTPAQRRKISFEAVGAAVLISVGFMLIGNAIFAFLQITENDFRIAGGVLLLVLAMLDLLGTGKPAVYEPQIVGIVPLAMPLIAGPATLTTVLVLAGREELGYLITTLGLLANFVLLLTVMLSADAISRIVGANALRALSKLVMVLLAAIAVFFIRSGVTNIIMELRGK